MSKCPPGCECSRHNPKTPETRAKISAATRGKPQPWNAGDANPMRRPEVRAKNSAARRGKPLSPEHRAAVGDAQRGKTRGPCSPETCAKIADALRGKPQPWNASNLHPNWRGDEAGYGAAHKRVAALRGLASSHPCADGCGAQAAHWSYDGGDPDERADAAGHYAGKLFSFDPARYSARCPRCHAAYDAARVVSAQRL